MEQQEAIEMELWEYLDGTCTEADRNRIALLIQSNAMWKECFDELSALHQQIPALMEEEQPSMRFTKDVMDAVARVQIAPATKQYINKGIIRAIAAFFVIAITTIIGYALAHADWSSTAAFVPVPKMSFDRVDTSALFNSGYINAIIAVNVVLGLVLIDKMLRRKHPQETD